MSRRTGSRTWILLVISALLPVLGSSSPMWAADQAWFSFRGTLTPGPREDFSFLIGADANLVFRTFAYAGGTNAAGEVIPSGGIDSSLWLYDANANLIGSSSDANADSTISIRLSAWNYMVRMNGFLGTGIYNGTWATDLVNSNGSLTIIQQTEANSLTNTLILGASGAAAATLQINSGSVTLNGTGTCLTPRAGGKVSVGGGTLNVKGGILIDGGQLGYTSGTFNWDPNRSMTVRSGGKFSYGGSYELPVGAYVNVRDANSQLYTQSIFAVDHGARVDANNAGSLDLGGLDLGMDGSGTLVLDGNGTRLTTVDAYMGSAGVGTLILQNQATGQVTSGSTLVGYGGTTGSAGNLTVQSGASLTTGAMDVGMGIGCRTTSTVLVTGTGSQISQTGSMNVGTTSDGNGVLRIEGSGTFTSLTGPVTIKKTGLISINGGTYNAKCDIAINGGTLERLAGWFNWDPNRAMNISNGGRFSYNIDYTLPTGAYVNVRDANSQFAVTTFLYVNNNARMDANAKGTIVAGAGMDLGTSVGGTVLVDGNGSRLTSPDVWMGANGALGTLTFQNQATGSFTAGTVKIGSNPSLGSRGVFTVQGGASVNMLGLEVGVYSGSRSTSTLTITGNGSVVTQGGASTLTVGAASDSNGIIQIDANGTFTGGTGLATVNPTGTISINGGTYNAKGNIDINGGLLLRNATGSFNWDPNLSMTIRNGGRFTSLGPYGLPDRSYVNVRDANSQLTVGPGVLFYVTDSARIDANNGGAIWAHELYVDTGGTVLVDGNNSSLTVAGALRITYFGGPGAVTLRNGASGNLSLVYIADGSWEEGSGGLTVSSRAHVTATNVRIATVAGDSKAGTLTVTGEGSQFTQTGSSTLTVGADANSTGEIHIDTNGRFEGGTGLTTINKTGIISIDGGTYSARGDILINGGLLERNSGLLIMDANRTMTIQNGGMFHHYMDYATGTRQTYTVSGAGSWIQFVLGSFWVMNDARVNVLGGGGINTFYLYLGVDGNGTVVVDGAGSSVSNTDTTVGRRLSGGSPRGELTFRNGSRGNLGDLELGHAEIPGASWGLLTVESDGNVTARHIYVAVDGGAGQVGAIIVRDAGSELVQTGSATVTVGAEAGSVGAIHIDANGTFTGGTGLTTINRMGTISIDGGTYNAKGNIDINGGLLLRNATGEFNWDADLSMTIRNGGRFTILGSYFLPERSYVNVRDANSQLTVGPGYLFDVTDSARIDANNGGAVWAYELYVDTGGTVLVDGNNSSLTVAGALRITYFRGPGAVTLQNGATGNLGFVYIADGPWYEGSGSLTVSSRAQATATDVRIATVAGDSKPGMLTVTGAGSQFTQTGSSTLIVGADANSTGSLHIDDWGTFTGATGLTTINRNGAISIDGGTYNAKGNIDINGGELEQVGALSAFNWDPNRTMTIRNDGRFRTPWSYALPTGAYINVRDAGSSLQIGSTLTVSRFSRIDANSGGTVSAGVLEIGTSGDGTVLVDGNGSSLTASISSIGHAGATGTLTFQNRSTGSCSYMFLAATSSPGSGANLTVQSGASLTTYEILAGTYGATGQLAVITVTGTGSQLSEPNGGMLILGADSDSTGVLLVTGGGTFTQGASGIHTCIAAQIGRGSTIVNPTGQLVINGGNVALGALTSDVGGVSLISGSLGFDGDLLVGPGGLFGNTLYLPGGRSLALSGTTTVDYGSTLNIDGGEFSTGSLVINGGLSWSTGTLALTNQDVIVGAGGFFGTNLTIPYGKKLCIAKTTIVSSGSMFSLEGGEFCGGTMINAGTILMDGGTFTLGSFTNLSSGRLFIDEDELVTLNGPVSNAGRIILEGGAARLDGNSILTNTGVITGDGEVSKNVLNDTGGEVRVEFGRTLLISGINGANGGNVNVLGGTVEFTRPLTNGAGGQINGRGTFIFSGGLTNYGKVQLSAGLSDVFGHIVNASGSKVIVTGGATATFYGPVDCNSGSEFRVSTGSTAVFFDQVHGSNFFTGPGTKIFEDGVSDLGDVWTTGDTIVQEPAVVGAASFRENALTVNGAVNIARNGTDSGTSVVHGLSIGGGPGAWTGKLDLADNDLIVKYGGSGSPIGRITEWVRSGFNDYSWNGTGICSGEAANDGNQIRALGVLDNRLYEYTEWSGQTGLDGNEVLVKFTWYGDADMNGEVNYDDYLQWEGGLGGSGTGWLYGDFDYNGEVNYDDYLLWEGALGSQTGILSGAAAVPEPATMGVLVAGAIGLVLRRRRRTARRTSDLGRPA